MRKILFTIAAAAVLASSGAWAGKHHAYYSYPGDQVHRGDVYRYGPPENGGYRSGYYNGRYRDNTYYDD